MHGDLSSLKDPRLHGQLVDFMTLLIHHMLQILSTDWQLSVLDDEALHDVAVVDVDREDFGQAHEHTVLDLVLRIDERSQLL